MKNALTPEEMEYLNTAFPDERKRETEKPNGADVEALRLASLAYARVVLEHCPACADRSAALRDIRNAFRNALDALTKRFGRGT